MLYVNIDFVKFMLNQNELSHQNTFFSYFELNLTNKLCIIISFKFI